MRLLTYYQLLGCCLFALFSLSSLHAQLAIKNNIPVIFYFNGTHADYHQPTDTPDKINYEMLENRTRLVFHTAWELANRDNRVIVDKGEKAK